VRAGGAVAALSWVNDCEGRKWHKTASASFGGGGEPLKQYRELAADELGRARAFLGRMAPDDQMHHFQQIMSEADLDAWEMRARDHRLIGYFEHDHLFGMAELAYGDDQAECSVCVDAGHRRQGIGTALFERACSAAREGGARYLTVLVTRGDAEMLDLAVRHHGLSVFRHGQSMILPEGDHGTARWLVFELDEALEEKTPEDWFSHAVRSVREILGL